MSKIVGCGIVGCGVIGPTHALCISRIPEAKLVAVCDVVPERAQKLGEEYGAQVYTDFAEMLKNPEIDLIHVCLPSGMHADFGVQAAKAGKHVIVEKPIDVSLEAADRLIKTCRECGVKLSVISQHRFDPGIVELKKAIDAGQLGKLTFGGSHTKWYRSQEYYDSGDWRGTWALDGGGALMNQSVHYVDMVQYCLGPVTELSAYCATLSHERIEVEDIATATLKFASGALGLLEGNTTAYPGFCTRLDVYGTKGGVIIENDHIKEWKVEGVENPHSAGGEGGGAGSAAIPAASHGRQIADVIDAILTDRDPLVTGENGRHPLEIVLKVYESARQNGNPVKLG